MQINSDVRTYIYTLLDDFDHEIIRRREQSQSFCRRATARGHLNIFKWALEQEYNWDFDSYLYAAIQGRISIIKWILSNGWKWRSTYRHSTTRNVLMHPSVADGRVEILMWAQECGYQPDFNTYRWALMNDDKITAKYIKQILIKNMKM